MNFDFGMPLVPEIAVAGLAVTVFFMGLLGREDGHQSGGDRNRQVGWFCFVGLLSIFGLTFLADEGRAILGDTFVQDSLAIFAKQLFLAATALSLLGSVTLKQPSFNRRAAEYHFLLLLSLLGMLVLASARELVLFFVAFELMSIPLYLLTGFLKRDAIAPEAALKFFLVGTVSSAVILYGMSFVYGVTGSTALTAIPGGLASGNPLMLLGMAILLAGLGFKIAASCGRQTRMKRPAPRSWPGCRWRPRLPGSWPSSACTSKG
jgi:NADH-quinone oxidoreductase subunit N